MASPRLRWTLLALAALLVCAAVPARANAPVTEASADDPTGAPASHVVRAPAAVAIPAGLDDMLQPLRDVVPGPGRPDVSDAARASAPSAAPATPLSKRLASLDPAQRENASIEVDLPPDADVAAHALARDVPAMWEAREYDAALDLLRAFEERGGRYALGIAWKQPAPANGLHDGVDVRLGTRTDCQSVCLDYDRLSGILLTVARWGGTAGEAEWTVMRTTVAGTLWTETYAYLTFGGLWDVSAAVAGDFLYVGYVSAGMPTSVTLRRFHATGGAFDADYGTRVALTALGVAFGEVCVVSNANDWNDRVYVLALQADHVLRYAWDAASDGTRFSEIATPVDDADFGMDASWGNGAACGAYLFVTFASTDGTIHLASCMPVVGWSVRSLASATGVSRPTAVSVHGTMVICAYEWMYTEGRGIRYSISYDCGSTWNYGQPAVPDGVEVTGYFSPDVDASDPYGTALTYQGEAGVFDTVYYHYRWGFEPGGWRARTRFNQFDVLTGTPTTIAHLPRLSAHTMSHGAVYCIDDRIPYFNYPGYGILDAPPVEVPAGLALRLASANPARGAARFELGLPRAGRAAVRVHDVSGALVRELADGEFGAGTHVLTWDGANAAGVPAKPGVYFVRVCTERAEVGAKLVFLR